MEPVRKMLFCEMHELFRPERLTILNQPGWPIVNCLLLGWHLLSGSLYQYGINNEVSGMRYCSLALYFPFCSFKICLTGSGSFSSGLAKWVFREMVVYSCFLSRFEPCPFWAKVQLSEFAWVWRFRIRGGGTRRPGCSDGPRFQQRVRLAISAAFEEACPRLAVA